MLTARFEPGSQDLNQRVVQLVGYCININGSHAHLLGSSNAFLWSGGVA
jgi:hypothetical protein